MMRLSRWPVRNIICQRRSAIDFDRVLNRRKIRLANLSTGLLTEKIAGMFGSFLVTKIVNAAFRRAKIPEEQRRPWYLYIDEFQAFMNLSVGFERILAEARKYKLVLAGMANQYVGQLSTPVRQAIFGNIGTMVTFRLGVDDSYILAKEMGVFTAEELLSLELGQAIVRAGGSSTAFNLTTYREPPPRDDDPTPQVVANTRTRYAQSRKTVEDALAHAAATDETSAEPPQPSRNGRRRRRNSAPPRTPRPEPRDPNEDDLVV